MEDLFKKFVNAGVGFVSLTTDRVQKTVDALVKESKLSEQEGAKIMDELRKNSDSKRKELEKQFQGLTSRLMKTVGVAPNSELEELKRSSKGSASKSSSSSASSSASAAKGSAAKPATKSAAKPATSATSKAAGAVKKVADKTSAAAGKTQKSAAATAGAAAKKEDNKGAGNSGNASSGSDNGNS